MRFDLFAIALVASCVVFANGCATIVSDSSYDVLVQSNPQGAAFRVLDKDGAEVARGVTPETVRLDAQGKWKLPAKYTVEADHPGYGRNRSEMKTGFDAWTIGNVAMGGVGVVGLVVDGLSGAMYKLPEAHSADLANGGYASNLETTAGSEGGTAATTGGRGNDPAIEQVSFETTATNESVPQPR